MRGPGQQYQGRPEAALSAYQQRAVSSSLENHIHVAICATLASATRPSCPEMSCAASSAEENWTSSRRRPCGQELAADGD